MEFTQSAPCAAHSMPQVRCWRCTGVSSVLLVLAAIGCRKTTGPSPAMQAPGSLQQASAPQETWDAVFIGGTQVGSVHTTTTQEGDAETPSVKIVSDTQLSIARFGNVANMRVVTESVETAAGIVLSFSHRTESGASPIVVEGRVQPDRVILTHRTAGKETTTQLPWNADQGGFFAVEGSLRRALMQPGEQRTLSLLMPGLTGVQLAQATLEAQQYELTKLLDGSQSLLKIKQTLHAGGLRLEGFCWTDAQGEIIKSTLADLQQETYRTSRERALAHASGDGFDIGFDTIVRVASPLPHPHSTRQVVYEATLQQRNPAETFASGASQRVEPVDDRRARITVRAIRPGDPPAVATDSPPTDADRNANSLIQSDDERIRQLASTIAADVTDPWQTCVALEKWVHDGIQKKNFSQGFATAADVAQSLEGDCTEHAVLLAALCRARQIPARVCVGLVYSPNDQGFAFHMWNEAWITDRWIPLDATLGLGGIGAAHLKLRHSDLSSEQAESAVLSVLQVMNQLQLQVVEVQ
jgi:hypothetical protein